MPPWGRPPGGGNKKARREWERQMREWDSMQQPRFQELDSDDDDDDGQGVHLDPKYLQQQGGRYSGDELFFTGADMGAYLRKPAKGQNRSYENLAYGEPPYESDDDEDDGQANMALQVAMKDKEQELVRSALARIQRAREKGKPNVNLSQEEVEALERHRTHQQQITAASSSSKPKNDKAKKRPSRLFSSGPSSTAPKSSKSRSRRSGGGLSSQSPDEITHNINSAPPGGAPGILVPGPGGTSTYAPLGFRTRDSPPTTSRSSPSRPTSRSASGSKQQTSPPQMSYNSYSLSQYPSSQFASSTSDFRPPSSSSRNSPTRSLPDDPNWAPRSRSTSTANPSQEASAAYPGVYASHQQQQPPYPTSTGRRNVSGPAAPEISYSTVPRRKPLSAAGTGAGRQPLQPPPLSHASHSDPSGIRRVPGGVPVGIEVEVEESSSEEGESSEESEEEGQGVQVESQRYAGSAGVRASYGYGYASGARGGGSGFQRRSGR
ncbi:hypothetical protein EV356DRAFT_529969 [Viridothelium virens]|uniref:Prenylated rab acceptor 1 n=1 Tax=Viridothelium virens TaxID=1048519 RepID=A0A6A6HHM4_VIRVR|nr:hypothetical protein EV356DRAFT_529969 [Viridothelium virens]